MKKVLPIILCSNERKDNILQETLKSFRETDWPEEPVCMFDGNIHTRADFNCIANTVCAFKKFLASDYDYLLFLEDDLIFNKYLYHNVQNWSPIKYNFLLFGNLFHFMMNPLYDKEYAFRRDNNYLLQDTWITHNSKAYVLNRQAVQYVLDGWETFPAWPDIRIAKILERLYSVVFIYIPGLIQHRDSPSTTMPDHVALCKGIDFDINYKSR